MVVSSPVAQAVELDKATVTPPVRVALGLPAAQVDEWRAEPFGGSYGKATAGLYRVSGAATDGGKTHSWSIVLKVLASPAGVDAASGTTLPDYWRREALVYESGLLDRLPEGIAAPRCLAVDDRGESVWLWLEDLGEIAEPWSIARFSLAARHLGRFNGAYLAGEPLPDLPWLSRQQHRVRRASATADKVLAQVPSVQSHPLGRDAWPDSKVEALRRLCDERDVFLDAIERCPQVLRHGDTGRPNLASREAAFGTQTVALDWALLGIDTAGDDLAPLVAFAGLRQHFPADLLPELDAACFDAYLEGLAEAGWHGDPQVVRLGFTACAALRYALIGPFFEVGFVDDSLRPALERSFGNPLEVMSERFADIQRYCLRLADEARDLIAAGNSK
jgi:hypothetical protein